MAVIDSPTGETPLTSFQHIDTTGGSDQAAHEWAFLDFQKQFGRNPTQSELDQLAPQYSIGDPNKLNLGAGKAAVASYYTSLASNPTNIAANQQKKALDAYNTGKGNYDTQTNQIFQQSLGRNASDAEAQHFGSLIASGQIDQYGLNQLLGQSQEAQQRQTSQYQDQLGKNLQGTQGDYYKNYILPSIQSNFASQGRDVNSSGFANAAVQAGKQQNYDLQNYLANFGATQYGQSAQNQQSVYQQYLGNLYGLQNADVSQQLGQQAYTQQRNTDIANYQLQNQAYQNYLNQYGKRNNGLGQIIGGVAGGALGAFGGPAGVAAGFQIGSTLGGAVQGGGNQSYQPQTNYGGLSNSWGRSGGQQALPYGQI